MKRTFSMTMAFATGLLLTPADAAHAAGVELDVATVEVRALAGTVSGRVLNADGDALPGAAVRIVGTGIGTQTDIHGRFTLARVPAGTHQVSANYLGYDESTVGVTVTDGETSTVRITLTPKAIAIEGLMVLGETSQGQAKALTQQKNAPNLQSIVSEEQIQRSPDNHAVDAVARLPGVAVAREEGEAEEVQIRGVSPQYNSVTINGQRVATPSGSRAPRIDMLQADLIKQITVVKALTPEQEADAIGGSIDFKLAEAPQQPLATVGIEGGYNDYPNHTQEYGSTNRSGRISLGKRFMEDQALGVLISASAQNREHGHMNNQYIYEERFDRNSPMFNVIHNSRSTDRDWKRIRYGGVANLDYEFSPDSRMHVTGNFSTFDRDQIRRYIRRRRNFNKAGQVTRYWELQQPELAKLDQRFWMAEAGGDHLVQSAIFDYSASYSSAKRGFHRSHFDFRRNNPGLVNLQDWKRLPHTELAVAPTSAPYEFHHANESLDESPETLTSALANVKFPFYFLEEQSNVKVGTKVSWREMDNAQRDWRREPISAAAPTLPQTGVWGEFDNITFLDTENYEELLAGTDREFDEEDFIDSNWNVRERIAAVYAQTELNWTPKLMTLVGARVEHTLGDVFHPTTGRTDRDYTDVLPSVHALYRFNPGTQVRLAYSTGIARPDFDELAPYEYINRDDDGTGVSVNMGNPDLVAAHANSYDLMFETYSSGLGLLSGGLFYKKITDQLMGATRIEERGDEIWTFNFETNGEQAEVWGSEFAISRALDFMPDNLAFLRPFIVTANYTRMWSEATAFEGEDRRVLPAMLQTPPYTGNLIVTYSNPGIGFESTVSWNHRGPVLERVNRRGETWDRANDGENYVDATAVFDATRQLSVYLELDNVLDEGENTNWGWPQESWSRPRGFDYNGRQANIGVRYRF